jgi:Flp pilus assembly protein protease CpaA
VRRKSAAIRTWIKVLFAAFVLASLLFAHGCHGDEDHELFTTLATWVSPE